MKEECIICKAPLIYLEKDEMMECVLCHKKELSKTRCEQGHYVCNECHTKGMGVIIDICLSETSKNPIEIIRRMMAQPFCHMHGPEHHVMVGSALLTAYKNAGGEIDLPEALLEMMNRGKAVPGGVCGFWGACGAGISTGMFISIISGATPLKNEPWGLANKMTSKALDAIGSIGGPRCCKRDSYVKAHAVCDGSTTLITVKLHILHIVVFHDSQSSSLKLRLVAVHHSPALLLFTVKPHTCSNELFIGHALHCLLFHYCPPPNFSNAFVAQASQIPFP